MPTALVPLIDGFEETEAVATIDVLRRAGVEVVTAGVAGRRVTGSHAMTLEADVLFAEVAARDFDAVVLPGGPGTKGLNAVAGLHDCLRRHAAAGRIIAAICAAPTVLAAAGLLEGRRAACFPTVEGAMAGATVVHEAVVIDGRIITSRAMGTAVDFGLAVAAALAGEDRAADVARSILHSPAHP